MAAGRFLAKLLPLGRERFGSGASRALSRAASRSQLHGPERTRILTGKEDRFGGVTVDLSEAGLAQHVSENEFSELLRGTNGETEAGHVTCRLTNHLPAFTFDLQNHNDYDGFSSNPAKLDSSYLSLLFNSCCNQVKRSNRHFKCLTQH